MGELAARATEQRSLTSEVPSSSCTKGREGEGEAEQHQGEGSDLPYLDHPEVSLGGAQPISYFVPLPLGEGMEARSVPKRCWTEGGLISGHDEKERGHVSEERAMGLSLSMPERSGSLLPFGVRMDVRLIGQATSPREEH